ncbi:MAG: homoserine kinase [Myxococcota bacterium]
MSIAFAPASVANVAVGFDILGHSMDAIGDTVRVERISAPGVHIREIQGLPQALPMRAEENTAGRALLALLEARGLSGGFEVWIQKGIPLGSGLGGSAASAVAAVVAANALLDRPADPLELLRYAMEGEAVASGAVHVDNIAPSLFGGLILTVGVDAPRIKRIPTPETLRCVLVHPHMELSTKEARRILRPEVPLKDVVWQTANLAGVLAACFTGDLLLLREALADVIIEPQRKPLIPGFDAVQQGALAAGALGCSISGAGPTIFAWVEAERAAAVRDAMRAGFLGAGLASDAWISSIEPKGARLIP